LPFHFTKPSASLGHGQANFNSQSPYGGGKSGAALDRPCPVAQYEPNVLGLYDVHGNAWEWCQDWYSANYYKDSPKKDPTGPAQARYRGGRGGPYGAGGSGVRASVRSGHNQDGVIRNLGFRVAATPKR